jgi:hypothetical protein
MPYSASQQLDIRHSYFADVHDIAHGIQSTLEMVLREPEKGIYLPNQLDPVLRADHEYWYQQPVPIHQTTKPNSLYGDVLTVHNQSWQYYRYHYVRVENLEAVLSTPYDVVDMGVGFRPPYYHPTDPLPGSDAQPRATVLPHNRAHEASLTPTLPWAGIKIVHQMIDNEIASTRYFNHTPGRLIEEIVMPFISATYLPITLSDRDKIEHLKTDPWFIRAFSGIFEEMRFVLAPIRDALRHNPYQMCTVNYLDGYQIRVDQLGDYRIHEWERIMNDPDYQRFLRAKADGTLTQLLPDPHSPHPYR